MNRTRIIFISIVVAALLIVGVTVLVTNQGGGTAGTSLTVQRPDTVAIRILTSLPVEPWVRNAAEQFNAEKRTIDGVPIQVQVEAVDGLTALGRWDRNEFGALTADQTPETLTDAERAELAKFPVAWIPDSRYLVELANAAYKERLGRDVFLTDGEYRARPTAISLFTWGLYNSRADVLEQNYGDINWEAIHNAATAAGEYYGRTNISVEDVVNPEFQKWLKELMGAVTDFSSSSAYTAEDFALFGYSVGDGGQLLESDLLQNMQGILTRWEDPLALYYPEYLTWFDFPFSVWVGPETTALQKNAALEFQRYLLNDEQQKAALAYGLRPANPNIPVDASEESLFTKWADRGVLPVVPRTTAMRSPDRETLLALLRWFDLNVKQ
ncbi:MAG: substrate-binding domain-containing protein [Caldilinea sp.]